MLPVPAYLSGHAGGTRAVGPLGSGDLSRLVAKKKKKIERQREGYMYDDAQKKKRKKEKTCQTWRCVRG